MLDKRTKFLLNVINKECVNSGYKVLGINDLILSMPLEFGADKETVIECINTLSEKEYVSVKYLDELEVCLTPLSKGRLVFENRIDQEIEKRTFQKKYFIFAFLGSLLGGFIAGIFAVIIMLFGGR